MAQQGSGHEFKVEMTCDGCSNAIKRILGKVEGVDSVEADHAAHQVLVHGNVSADTVEEKLRKWASASGKKVQYVGVINA